ncbi:MAG: hypothetical protein NVV60_02695 [Luteimonas sp.]|nr:hypothetical protein [Luteimonas sp.]
MSASSIALIGAFVAILGGLVAVLAALGASKAARRKDTADSAAGGVFESERERGASDEAGDGGGDGGGGGD